MGSERLTSAERADAVPLRWPACAFPIVTIVGGFAMALALARASDLIASVPGSTGELRNGMHSFPLPIATPELTISMLWHPRLHADPVHGWLRECVRDVCAEQRDH